MDLFKIVYLLLHPYCVDTHTHTHTHYVCVMVHECPPVSLPKLHSNGRQVWQGLVTNAMPLHFRLNVSQMAAPRAIMPCLGVHFLVGHRFGNFVDCHISSRCHQASHSCLIKDITSHLILSICQTRSLP